ncbi:MAG TPA: acetylglutamate kinase [Thermoanaerobaculia bacterium]|jgi:acetylglutamate kinase|nr:acetylglutamate kinase [Thermoanaerobaculia bacterium]
MKDVGQRTAEATALKHAVPYIRIFKGKTFVLKAGGGALERESTARDLIEQIEVLHQVGIRVVLVHGGGTQSTDLARELGAETRFVEGRRVTDAKALEVATMVLNGTVNTHLLAVCRSVGLPAVGVSGVDAGLIQARKRPPMRVGGEMVDYGFVGDVAGVDPKVLTDLMDAGYVPVVSPLSAAEDGTVLNINADTIASALAVALQAEKLLFLTGAPGILERADDPGSLVSYTDLAGLRRLRDEGGLVRGMLPKTSAIEAAIQGGVRRVHILSHDLPDGLLAEVFTNEGVGTLVVEDVRILSPAEAAAGTAATPVPVLTGVGAV